MWIMKWFKHEDEKKDWNKKCTLKNENKLDTSPITMAAIQFLIDEGWISPNQTTLLSSNCNMDWNLGFVSFFNWNAKKHVVEM